MIAGVVGATNMNLHSSRSHAIFSITVESCEEGFDGKERIRAGKLHLVDLAVSFCIMYIHEQKRKQKSKEFNFVLKRNKVVTALAYKI